MDKFQKQGILYLPMKNVYKYLRKPVPGRLPSPRESFSPEFGRCVGFGRLLVMTETTPSDASGMRQIGGRSRPGMEKRRILIGITGVL